ncbi:hypothetical protein LX36DRAFT_357765 [Colletotrichum falcatum]|nr:hypothetical protein LX36DRAFT_357765 [Colletotrichum falcatum]
MSQKRRQQRLVEKLAWLVVVVVFVVFVVERKGGRRSRADKTAVSCWPPGQLNWSFVVVVAFRRPLPKVPGIRT